MLGTTVGQENGMFSLTEYIDKKTLSQLQLAFGAVAGYPIAICSADGTAVFVNNRITPSHELFAQTSIKYEGEIIGYLRMYQPADTDKLDVALESFRIKLLKLMANVLIRFCRETTLRRARIRQIMTINRVMANITSGGNLQETLNLVTQKIVEALNAKACAIRLLSPDGQNLIIRALHCINPQYLDKAPMPVSESPLDQQTLATTKTVYVEDMTTDPRVKDPEVSAREGLISALCVALIYKDKPIGVLRVYKDYKYEFDWFERQMLKTMAGAAAAVIADAQLFKEVKESMRIKRQLSMARVVQRRLIPQKMPQAAGYDISPFYVPCQELSGDFYDFLELPGKNIGIVICDVVGKGVRASLLMATIRASLRAHASNVYEITDVLEKVNRDLCAGTEVSDFATIFYGVLDTKINRLTYCCAGHMPPVVVRNGKIFHLEARGGVIGIMPDMEYPKEFFDLKSGDVFFTYTDGLSEAANYHGEEFGRHRVEKALLGAVNQNLSAEGIDKYCVWEMRKFTGIQYNHDDLTMLAIKVR